MLEEKFARRGLNGDNVPRAVSEEEIEGLESRSDVGIRSSEPGAARVFGGENGDDALASLLDE
jgi:hypothetical protein